MGQPHSRSGEGDVDTKACRSDSFSLSSFEKNYAAVFNCSKRAYRRSACLVGVVGIQEAQTEPSGCLCSGLRLDPVCSSRTQTGVFFESANFQGWYILSLTSFLYVAAFT